MFIHKNSRPAEWMGTDAGRGSTILVCLGLKAFGDHETFRAQTHVVKDKRNVWSVPLEVSNFVV